MFNSVRQGGKVRTELQGIWFCRLTVFLVFAVAFSVLFLSFAEPIYRDVEVTLLTPFGTPMVGARVLARKPDGSQLVAVADTSGKVLVPQVSGGVVDVVVLSWRGMPINFVARNVTGGVVIVENIGKLIIVVTNLNGFYLENALVIVKGDNFTLLDLTDASGRFVAELPEGAYYVEVTRKQWKTSGQVPVKHSETTIAQFILNFVTVSGFEVSPEDAIGYAILSVLIGIVLYIIKEEYSIYRKRRIQIRSPGAQKKDNPCECVSSL
ncbi:MAG: hypothetical protein LM573_01120 [Thermofilum sp.]|nr:hypothetical protein [Thermofilum sp.]